MNLCLEYTTTLHVKDLKFPFPIEDLGCNALTPLKDFLCEQGVWFGVSRAAGEVMSIHSSQNITSSVSDSPIIFICTPPTM